MPTITADGTTILAILDLVRKQLVNDVSWLGDSSCKIMQRGFRPSINTGGSFASVRFLNAPFDDGAWAGGGINVVRTTMNFDVVVYSTIKTDSSDDDTKMMLDTSRGLLSMAHHVLKALAMFDPLNSAGEKLLTEAVQPLGLDAANVDITENTPNVGEISLPFRCVLDLNLS